MCLVVLAIIKLHEPHFFLCWKVLNFFLVLVSVSQHTVCGVAKQKEEKEEELEHLKVNKSRKCGQKKNK